MASDPITSWQIDEETMETVTDFISLGSKVQMVTAAMKLKDACSLEGEGNGTPLQYSCLENSMDGGAWWAAVHGVAKSRTRSDLAAAAVAYSFPKCLYHFYNITSSV